MSDEETLDLDLDPVAFDLIGPNPHRATIDPAYNAFLTLMAEGTAYETIMINPSQLNPRIEQYGLCKLSCGRSRGVILFHVRDGIDQVVDVYDGMHYSALNWLRSKGVPILLARRMDYQLAPLTRPITEEDCNV